MESIQNARSNENALDSRGASRTRRAQERITFKLAFDGSIQEIETQADEDAGVLTALDRESLVATSLFRQIHEHDLLPVFRGVAELVDGESEEVPVGFRLRTAGGIWRVVQGTARLCGDGRTFVGLMLTLQILGSLG